MYILISFHCYNKQNDIPTTISLPLRLLFIDSNCLRGRFVHGKKFKMHAWNTIFTNTKTCKTMTRLGMYLILASYSLRCRIVVRIVYSYSDE